MTPAYTYHIGEKFHPDGTPRAFPGVTIICFADPAMPIYQAGERLQAELRALPFGHKFGALPPSSFHMTLFSLICDQRRTPAEWTPRLPLDAPLPQVDAFFIDALAAMTPPHGLRMVMTYLGGWGLSLRLSPADETTYTALKAFRQQVSALTGVRHPDHDTYEYHLTLAYQLIALDDAERAAYTAFRDAWGERLRAEIGVFAPPPPLLTFFEDMFAFVPAAQRHHLPSRGGG